MASLRKMIDGQIKDSSVKISQRNFKAQDQVVVRKPIGRGGPTTREVIVGTIAAMAEDGKSATVSFPRPGGRLLRSTIPIAQMEHVSATFKRSSVQFNPAFRGVFVGSV